MSNNHKITKDYGNLRGLSTDSIFLRPPYVADKATNLQRAPDNTQQIRRGYQCQIGEIGGMGLGTFDDPALDYIQTVSIGLDGYAYNKLQRQIYFSYNGQVSGNITAATQAYPTQITSDNHGLLSGTHITIYDVGGMISINNQNYAIAVVDANNFKLYNLKNVGIIANATQANPCQIQSPSHGRTTGDWIMIQNVKGMVNLNDTAYQITVIDANNFTLNGVDSTSYPAYTSGGFWVLGEDSTAFLAYTMGGYWTISFTENRYLLFTIFTDPRFLTTNPGWSVGAWSLTPWGAPSGESITCNITVNRAAQINGNQSNTNTLIVQYGHELVATDIIQFTSSNGTFNQRIILSVTANSITFDGFPVTVLDGYYINQFFDIPFRKGFDTVGPFSIAEFIAIITNPSTGIDGLQVDANGDTSYPAAFLQIIEPTIIDSNSLFTINYWYWDQINCTAFPPLPGSGNIVFQNSPDMEIASMAAFDDVLFIANGWDYPQKYDGQTIYRAGMPPGIRSSETDNNTNTCLPFSDGNVYQYGITYEQIDNRGHIVEGAISAFDTHTVGASGGAINVSVTNLINSTGSNWNTNCAQAVGGTAATYGPDANGYYYNLVSLNTGFSLKLGDTAYYGDLTCGVMNSTQANTLKINVQSGHGIVSGDIVAFVDSSSHQIYRPVVSTTASSFTISGQPVSVDYTMGAAFTNVLVYKQSAVFGDVAIVNGSQFDVNIIMVSNANGGHTIQLNDVVQFIDMNQNMQQRTVTAVSSTSITISGNPISISNLSLISCITLRNNAINLQRTNLNGAKLGTNAPISNNLRINIYRTPNNSPFDTIGLAYLVASIPNTTIGSSTQVFIDGIADAELGQVLEFEDPDELPDPPPISKYVKSFGNQLFFGGGERGNSENSDRVFFSEGNNPEYVPLASHFFNVPNTDDEVTGLGVSGTTLVTTKNQSLWAATGNFLSGQVSVVQIAPGTNIGCVANASIASVGTLMYFLHTNGVYAITENQLFPTDSFGNPIPISLAIDQIFRETPFLPQYRPVFKRAVAVNYTKDNQYILFLPCENSQSTIRTANANSFILCYDYGQKNWYPWTNMNAAGGMCVINDDLFFQERRYSAVDGNTANLYKQHRFYRLVDHADHAGSQFAEWRSSWADLGQPEVRKKFCRCILLMDRLSDLQQYNNPQMKFSSYVNRIPNLQNTIANITQVDNVRNSSWSNSGWGWNYWSGYQDSFVTINLKGGTVAKSMQVGFTIQGINMDIRLAGFQLEVIPENRNTVVR